MTIDVSTGRGFDRDRRDAACDISMDAKWLLPPVSLDQINAVAPLQTRVDRKYVLPAAQAWTIIHGAAPGAYILEIEGRRDFAYRSTYFDTTGLAAFYGAAQRRRRRFKVRIRRYDDTRCFLEIKTRDGRGRSVKYRSPRPVDIAPRLREQDLVHVRRILAENGIDLDSAAPDGSLVTALTTRYIRSTIHVPDSGSRVTVDHDLVWCDPTGRELALGGHVIVETKSARAASSVDRQLWRTGHRPQRISKYATGMALLFPGLPGNRWNRITAELSDHLVDPRTI